MKYLFIFLIFISFPVYSSYYYTSSKVAAFAGCYSSFDTSRNPPYWACIDTGSQVINGQWRVYKTKIAQGGNWDNWLYPIGVMGCSEPLVFDETTKDCQPPPPSCNDYIGQTNIVSGWSSDLDVPNQYCFDGGDGLTCSADVQTITSSNGTVSAQYSISGATCGTPDTDPDGYPECQDIVGFCTGSGFCAGSFGTEQTSQCSDDPTDNPAPPPPVDCGDGTTAATNEECAPIPDPTITCNDGSKAANYSLCPATTVNCSDGSTASSFSECPIDPDPEPTPITCHDGSTAASLSDCPPLPDPPPSNVTCWDGSTAIDLASCPPDPTPIPYLTCSDGSKVTDLALCPPTTVNCQNGTTAATLADCPAVTVSCPDGSTAPTIEECPETHVKCDDGSTAKTVAECPQEKQCTNGTIVFNLSDCPETLARTQCTETTNVVECDGDPVNCAILQEIHNIACQSIPEETEIIVDETTTQLGSIATELLTTDSLDEDEEIDVSEYLDYSGLGWSEACPAPRAYMLGTVGAFELDLSPFCDLADIIGYLVMFTATMISLRIMFT